MKSRFSYRGKKLLIATKHQKEKVIAPILEKELGVVCRVDSSIDTDQLGTFSGEVQRKDDPKTTARNKCLMAIELAKCDLVVSSEGSFGAHPTIFFAPADEELLLFLDKRNNLEIMSKELSLETNYKSSEIYTEADLWDFAKSVKFPSHGLILRKSKDDFSELKKGIIDYAVLYDSFNHFITNYKQVFVETDMRAMYNPTRMKVIERATKKLVDKINSTCPNCNTAGFGITNTKSGLPCDSCNYPTKSIVSHIYSCQKCLYTQEKKYPKEKFTEDPMFCDRCNP